MLSVGHVVTSSVGMCDIDIRPVSDVNDCSMIDDSYYHVLIYSTYNMVAYLFVLAEFVQQCDHGGRKHAAQWLHRPLESRPHLQNTTGERTSNPVIPLRLAIRNSSAGCNIIIRFHACSFFLLFLHDMTLLLLFVHVFRA